MLCCEKQTGKCSEPFCEEPPPQQWCRKNILSMMIVVVFKEQRLLHSHMYLGRQLCDLFSFMFNIDNNRFLAGYLVAVCINIADGGYFYANDQLYCLIAEARGCGGSCQSVSQSICLANMYT